MTTNLNIHVERTVLIFLSSHDKCIIKKNKNNLLHNNGVFYIIHYVAPLQIVAWCNYFKTYKNITIKYSYLNKSL
jgi:hypothetical protein